MRTAETADARMLLTPRQAAQALAISPRKLWGMTASGEIPYLKIGRLTRYSVDDIARWIESRRKPLSGEASK